MYPVYKDMNSYPYQTPPAPFTFPSWEPFRPQMKEDGANTRPMPENWPSNYGYPSPMPCQNCCTHGQQPSFYNFGPPYPNFPMPPSCGHYYGGYPAAYPQPYPYPYVPPPHYSMEMPRYDFDKGSPKPWHCCECPNHPSHVKSTSNVKIEEQDPDVETKKVAPLIPTGLNSSPHPLMWAPPGFVMNKEQPRRVVEGGNLVEPKVCSNVEKPKKSIQAAEQDPNVRYQWLPLDIDSIKRLMEGAESIKPQEKKDGDEKKTSDVEKKDQNKQFSYPIIWMPYGGQGEQTRGQEEKNISKSPAEEAGNRNKAKSPVVEHPDKGLLKERIESGDDANGAGSRESRKTGNVKIIPVKQLDDSVTKSEKKEREGELNNSVKPSSPTKKSKLPPICLRVDPLRKKNGKGSSRSPSPPGEKRHQASSDLKEAEKEKKKIQIMEVAGNAPKENGVAVPDVTKEEKGSGTREHESEAEEKVVLFSDSSKLNATVCEDSAVDAPERKILSETEAAVIIQSAYRGYAVRRLEPLTKLRHIANVKEEARKVGERVEKIESCVTVNDKEKVAIGEMIMNLLLKLDTIQGLHASVRDVRKSVAKELIRLQEKLDSIVSQVSIPAGEQSAGSVEIISEASKTSQLGEKEAEEASVGQVSPSQSLESQVTDKVELGRESHNEEILPPSGSEYEVLKPEEIVTPLEDPSVEIQVDVLADQKPFNEGNQDVEVIQENVENDILRMEWECDLGAVKIDREETEVAGPPRESHEQLIDIACPAEKCDEDVASALEAEKVTEDLVENDIEIETPGNCDKKQEVDQSQVQGDNFEAENLNESARENLEEVGDDICRMDWECDIGAAKFTDGTEQETTQIAESRGHEKLASEVENLETEDQVDQLSDKSQVQSDAGESETTIGILDTDAQASEIPDGSMEVPIAEVEKQTIAELPVSEVVREECSLDLPTSPTDTQQYSEQIDRVETNRKIIEENEKLRSMVEQLLASGKDQQNVISTLTAKFNALEKKLPKRRNKLRSSKRPRVVLPRNVS